MVYKKNFNHFPHLRVSAFESFIRKQSEQFWTASKEFWSRKDQCYKTSEELTEEAIQKVEKEVKTKLSCLSTSLHRWVSNSNTIPPLESKTHVA